MGLSFKSRILITHTIVYLGTWELWSISSEPEAGSVFSTQNKVVKMCSRERHRAKTTTTNRTKP